ncbi:MAG: hypothetical protein RML57_01530 [Acidobacteriota bacterium]|nr:hypothetical protein [Acidobacteriota bacterium]
MAYDNLCKYLAETYPAAMVRWLARRCPELTGAAATPDAVQVLKTELPVELIRADFVTLLRATDRLLHVEFHVDPTSEPPLPLRMLDYWVRLYRLHRLPVTQVVVLLRENAAGQGLEEVFEVGGTRHRFTVVRLWEVEAGELLADEGAAAVGGFGEVGEWGGVVAGDGGAGGWGDGCGERAG